MNLISPIESRPGAIPRACSWTQRPAFVRQPIAELAYLNWQHDGCPPGRDVHYWLEAEGQLKATWHLLLAACDAGAAAEVLAEIHLTDLALAFSDQPA